MKIRVLVLLSLCLLMIMITACGGTGNSNPKVNVSTSVAAIKARIPTDTPIPPTPTIPPEDVVKDLSGVQLELEDFPDGFKPMSPADLDNMSMTPDKLAASFTKGLTKAKAQNPTGFIHQQGKKIDVVLSLIVYPLTMLESGGFDADLSEPQKISDQFVSPIGSDVKMLDGLQEIGEKTVAFDFKVNQKDKKDPPARSQVVFSRRGNAVIMIFTMYFNSPEPGVQAIELARKLDGRLAEALAK